MDKELNYILKLEAENNTLKSDLDAKALWIKNHTEGRTESFKKGSDWGFKKGVLFSAWYIAKIADQPKMAYELLFENGYADENKIKGIDKGEAKILRKCIKDNKQRR